MPTLPYRANIVRLLTARAELIFKTGWAGGSFFVEQALRLVTNIVLAWLLTPAMLGTMLLINTLRTACELLTDIGIGQSIVHNKRGEEPLFYSTAWTVQIVRGALLFALALLIAWPISVLYDDPSLAILVPAASSAFLVSAFVSPARYILQRRVDTKRIALFRMVGAVLSSAIVIALAWYLRSIWALVLALPLGAVVGVVLSFRMLRLPDLRLVWDKSAFWAIFGYGKWVFASSLVYFAAGNFDRLYFADMVPFAVLGVYGIARTLSDSVLSLFSRLSSQILFPKVAGAKARGSALRRQMAGVRRAVVWAVALALASLMAVSDVLIGLLYDDRYAAAGIYLPILVAGAWFGTLAVLSESVLMGIGRPSNVALGNATKLAVIVALVPLVLATYGITAAVFVFAGVEIIRWAVLGWRQGAHGVSFFAQDLAASAGFIVMALILREATGMLGFTDGVADWVGIVRGAFES